MKTLEDYINLDLMNWFVANNLNYKIANIKIDKGLLIIIFNENYCIKIYDRLGHGFGVNVNVAEKYDESLYDNDSFTLTWAFEYFKIKQTASFYSRSENQYLNSLPNLINDLKNIFSRLTNMTEIEWTSMKEWITKSAFERFT
ncbi:MAG: hypothetical protein EOO46_16575 [Flavobacterium sp.]|nr:MAG: hypothetical protein EOO46_16575 [Flavobacterium sp.]